MIHFFSFLQLNLSQKEYYQKIKTVLVYDLQIFSNYEFEKILTNTDIKIGWNDNNQIFINFEFFNMPVFNQVKKIYDNKKVVINDQTEFNFSLNNTKNFNKLNLIKVLELYLLDKFPNNIFTMYLAEINTKIVDNKVIFILDNQDIYDAFQKIFYQINQFIEWFFSSNNLKISFEKNYEIKVQKITINNKHKEKKLINNVLEISFKNKSNTLFQVWDINTKTIANINYEVVQIKNKTDYFCCIIDKKIIKSNLFKQLKKNDWIKPILIIDKTKKTNRIADFILVNFELIPVIENQKIINSTTQKICNLFVHTKASTHDGLFEFEDLIKTAQANKQKAIAITDLNSTTAYPSIEVCAKKYNVKPIYGIEFDLLPSANSIVNPSTKIVDLYNETYCVFDIETTGLNALFDDLIEIGVSKFKNSHLIKTYQKFIKTNQKIKPHIENITRINNELLDKKGEDIVVVLKEFLKFIDGSILVAHNGINFDLPFLNAKLSEHNLNKITNSLIDTLQLSRIIFEDARAHNLGVLCRRLEIYYDESLAHRADKDVEVLAEAFFKLLPLLEEKKIPVNNVSLIEINQKLQLPTLKKRLFTKSICAYAKNKLGIKKIYQLLSTACTKLFYKSPSIIWEIINANRENIIICNAPDNSDLWDAILMNDFNLFKKYVVNYDYVLIAPPSCYAHEINRLNYSEDQIKKAIQMFYDWTIKCNKKPIANGIVKYLNLENQNQYAAIVYAKQIGATTHKLFSYQSSNDVLPNYQFRSEKLLVDEFKFLKADLKAKNDFLFNFNHELVNQIENNIKIISQELSIPIIPNGEKLFKELTLERFKNKYGKNPDQYLIKRLKKELDAIINNGFSVIYWASHLLVKKSNDEGYLVGSRGSVGSSLIAYLINISEVNPLPPHYYCPKCLLTEFHFDFYNSGFDLTPKQCPKCHEKIFGDGHNIPFETFMGFNADKIPDIDLNFSGQYQAQAHTFLRTLFGKESCFRAGTVSTIAEKTAYGFAKNYLEATQQNQTIGKIDWIINKIIDVRRTSGQHPGGILVIPQNLSVYDFTPINFPADDLTSDWKTTHIEYKYLHDSLLKFDILGHDDPTILRMLQNLTDINPTTIPNHDPKILSLFTSCEILGINSYDILDEQTGAIGLPEFGTQFVRGMLKETHPKSFGDLIRISGLSHGTDVWRNNADMLIKKNNLSLSEVISCRDDVMIYLISKNIDPLLAFNIMECVRKEGKKIPVDAISILREKNVPEWYINSANLIKYMFPKAHAAAYVLMAWRVAYYKLYFPKEYYATYFSIRNDCFDVETMSQNNPDLIRNKYYNIKNRMNSKNFSERESVKNKEKKLLTIYEVALEMLVRNIKFRNVDLNNSQSLNFIPIKDSNEILIPFIAIDGLGGVAAEKIIYERQIRKFSSKKDLKERTRLTGTLIKKFEELKITNSLTETEQISLFDFFE